MARDYKPAMPRTETGSGGDGGKAGRGAGGGKRHPMNPMFIGIIIGLLLGIGLALILAIWLNRANNPFIEKSRPVEALPTISGRSLAAPVVPPVSLATKAPSEKPRFEFYQILPGEKGAKSDSPTPPKVTESALRSGPEAAPKTKLDAKPEVKPAGADARGEVFYLQAGAFQSATDAENMKANVAFVGFEAMVRPVNLPDKGTLYRVRLGPFRSIDEVNRIKVTLSQGGISAAIVKGSD